MKWFFAPFCLFVCLYVIQIHISEPISTAFCTRLPLFLEEVVGYVWTHNILTLFDLFDLFCQKPVQNSGHNMAAARQVIAIALYP